MALFESLCIEYFTKSALLAAVVHPKLSLVALMIPTTSSILGHLLK